MTENRYKPIINNHIYDENISYEDVKRELAKYKRQGFGGIGINGRSKSYVTDMKKWLANYFETVKKYCKAAKELELEMWIFDEWGFPSGSASGLVLDENKRAKKLNKAVDIILEKGEKINFDVPKRFVTAGAIPVDRFAHYHPTGSTKNIIPENGAIRFYAKEKTRLIIVTWENVSFHTNELRNTEKITDESTFGTVDIMDYETVQCFINNMHERYARAVGDEFGKTVKGFFYDEPEICWEFPYSPGLLNFFEDIHGYDLRTILPEMLAYLNFGGIELGKTGFQKRLRKIYSDYEDAYTSMLERNFFGQIKKWCHNHDLFSIGHQDMDNNICTLNTVSGDFFKNSRENDMPGIDVIHDHIIPERFADFPRYAGSVKRALKKTGAMSETFAVMGEFMPADVMRYDLEYQILRGIDKFFLYMNKSDPSGGEYKKNVMERATLTTKMMNSGTPCAKVHIFMPLSDISYTRMNLNPHSNIVSPTPWERVEKVAKALCYEPIDFDYAWDGALENLYERGCRHLIMTGSPVSDAAVEQIMAFHNKGGRVWSVFRPCEQMGVCEFRYYLWALIDELPHDIKVSGSKLKVSVTAREMNGYKMYALLNESERIAVTDITFAEDKVSYFDFDRRIWISYTNDKNDKTRRITFAPRELKLIRVGCDGDVAENVVSSVLLDKWRFNNKPIEKLVSWTELGLGGFSGYAEYETEFNWTGGIAKISLGEIRFSAKVILNGNEYQLPFSPWSFQTELPKGKHKMRVVVLNSGASEDYTILDKWHKPFEQPYLRCGMLGVPKIEKVEIIKKEIKENIGD